MSTRNYSGSAQATTLASPMSSSDTTFTVAAAVNWPSGNFIVTLDAGTASEEKVLVGSRAGTTCNSVTRGYDDTAALSHGPGASARHTFSAVDAREANTHINATTGVHGVTGSVVGTGGAQTLTGKTLITPTVTSPAISDPTITGTVVVAAGAIAQTAVNGLVAALTAKADQTALDALTTTVGTLTTTVGTKADTTTVTALSTAAVKPLNGSSNPRSTSGNFTVTFVAGVASGTVNFPATFAAPPIVVMDCGAITGNTPTVINQGGITTTGFAYKAWPAQGGTYSGTVQGYYVATTAS